MNEPLSDGPVVMRDLVYRPATPAMIRHDRVLTLAREMMLSDAAHGNGVKAAPYHFEDYTISASAWIRYEDAYVLPEDMQ